MIKRLLVCALVAVLVLSQSGLSSVTAIAAKKKVVKATKITLNHKAYTLKKGTKVTLKASIAPKTTTQKKVIWKSSNKTVATVTSKGIVSGKKYGKATITATVKGTKKKTTCKIQVVKTVKVSSVSLSLATVNLIVGQAYKLKSIINPSNASNKKVTWKSSTPTVASVNNGVITALTTGTTIITVTTMGGKKTASSTVTVTNPASGLTITPAAKEFLVGEELQLVSTLAPSNADNPNITWSSSDSSIATVTNGLVKALRPGKVTITGASADGRLSSTCTVDVLTSLHVMDIQGISDGNNTLIEMRATHGTLPGITLYGINQSLSTNFTVKVANGVTYEIAHLSGHQKIVTLHYKGQVKLYAISYLPTTEDSSSMNPFITGLSDGNNLFTAFSIPYTADTETTETIQITGMNASLSNNFAINVAPGVTYTITNDPRGIGFNNKIISLTKDNISHVYTVVYTRDQSKIDILAVSDGTNTITSFFATLNANRPQKYNQLAKVLPTSNYIGALNISGVNPTLSTSFSLEVVEGATYTLAEDPNKNYANIITVTYGNMNMTYYTNYYYDTRKAQLISVADPGVGSFSAYIDETEYDNGNGNSVGYVRISGNTPSLSSQFSATGALGCTCQIIDDVSHLYDKIIIVTKGSIQRKYFVTYTIVD